MLLWTWACCFTGKLVVWATWLMASVGVRVDSSHDWEIQSAVDSQNIQRESILTLALHEGSSVNKKRSNAMVYYGEAEHRAAVVIQRAFRAARLQKQFDQLMTLAMSSDRLDRRLSLLGPDVAVAGLVDAVEYKSHDAFPGSHALILGGRGAELPCRARATLCRKALGLERPSQQPLDGRGQLGTLVHHLVDGAAVARNRLHERLEPRAIHFAVAIEENHNFARGARSG